MAAGQLTVGPGSGHCHRCCSCNGIRPRDHVESQPEIRLPRRAATIASSEDAFRSVRLARRADQCRTTLCDESVVVSTLLGALRHLLVTCGPNGVAQQADQGRVGSKIVRTETHARCEIRTFVLISLVGHGSRNTVVTALSVTDLGMCR